MPSRSIPRAAVTIFSQNCTIDIVVVRNRRTQRRAKDAHFHTNESVLPSSSQSKRQHRQAQIHRAVAAIFALCTRRVRDIVAVGNRRTQRRAGGSHCSPKKAHSHRRNGGGNIAGCRSFPRAVAVIFSQNCTTCQKYCCS